MIGINSWSLKNNFEDLVEISSYNFFDSYECSKPFFLENYNKLDKLNLKCSCLSSIITGNYDLGIKNDREKFIEEIKESCEISNYLGTNKMMFGLSRFRQNINSDKIKFFKELIFIAKNYDIKLLYEAIPNDEFIKNHEELINFSKECGLNEIHVDFGTILKNCEDYTEIYKKAKVINIHYPIGDSKYPFGYPIIYDGDLSLENYNNYSNEEIKKWIKSLL